MPRLIIKWLKLFTFDEGIYDIQVVWMQLSTLRKSVGQYARWRKGIILNINITEYYDFVRRWKYPMSISCQYILEVEKQGLQTRCPQARFNIQTAHRRLNRTWWRGRTVTEDHLKSNFKEKYALPDQVDIHNFRLSPDTFLPTLFDARIEALLK